MAGRRGLDREQVIAQAAALADEAGSAEVVSLTALARSLGIRPPSLYNHVAGLEDLQRGMAVWALGQLLAHLRAASLGLVGREAILAMAEAYRGFARAHPGTYPLTLAAPGPEEVELAALSQELVQMLLLVMASLGLRDEEAIHAIRGLRAILHGFASLEAAGGYRMALDREESYQRLLRAYLGGIDNPGQTG